MNDENEKYVRIRAISNLPPGGFLLEESESEEALTWLRRV
jgi:hypothetical protein